MTPRSYRVLVPGPLHEIVRDIQWRLKRVGPVSVTVSQVGDEDEYARWLRRYWKLVGLIAEHVKHDGEHAKPNVWHFRLKGEFLPLEEVRLMSGQLVYQLASVRDLNQRARDDYLAQCQEFAAGHGVFLQHPTEEEA